MNILLRILITAVIAYALSRILSGIYIRDFWTAIGFSVVLALCNFLLKPLLVILTLPITILTFGLFLFVINAIVVLVAGKFVTGFHVNGFGWALLFSLLLSLITTILFRETKRRSWREKL
jgi:putative membrane protein